MPFEHSLTDPVHRAAISAFKKAVAPTRYSESGLPYVHQKSMSSCFPKSQTVCPHGQFLRQKPQRFKVIVEAVELTAENFFVVLLLLLQRGNFAHPPLHDAGTTAAALDKIIGLFLIQRDLLFDRGIKFLRHFVALLRVVNDVKAVDAEHIIVLILCTELLNERLECIDLAKVTRPWPRNYP